MRNIRPLPPIDLLRQLIDYDPSTGRMTWRLRDLRHFDRPQRCNFWNSRFAGKPALACRMRAGHLQGYVVGQMCLAHRVAYALQHNFDPPFEIDHINGDPSDNSADNLRPSDPSTNNRNLAKPKNNTSGCVGVYFQPARWRAVITVDDKSIHLGYFDTFEEAVAARKQAERDYGFHENHGRDLFIGEAA